MRATFLPSLMLAVLGGCASRTNLPPPAILAVDRSEAQPSSEVPPSPVYLAPDRRQPVTALSAPNDVDFAVRSGSAARSGPITKAKFLRWRRHEEMKLELALQCRQVRHRAQLLAIVEHQEQRFMKDLERYVRAHGTGIDQLLVTFEGLKRKYRRQLRLARQQADRLEQALVAWEQGEATRQPFDPFEGVDSMTRNLRLLTEIVSPLQMSRLAAHGIHDCRELALTFWLQHEQLAALLGISHSAASQLVEEAAKHVSKTELDELTRISSRIRTIDPGVLDPGVTERVDADERKEES